MRQIFRTDADERFFRERGYVVVDLLDEPAVEDLWTLYDDSFATRRAVVPYAEQLPYYISIFDLESAHKRLVDERISGHVETALARLMLDYDVFYSNFMIKFPGDGQIEAHQDFNFVDESRHTAFNLWSPPIDTDGSNTAYGMYIGLEEPDLERKRAVIREISRVVQPRVNEHFDDCKPHLGSFLVKAPGADSFTYPHQDWTFVDAPPHFSITVWIAWSTPTRRTAPWGSCAAASRSSRARPARRRRSSGPRRRGTRRSSTSISTSFHSGVREALFGT